MLSIQTPKAYKLCEYFLVITPCALKKNFLVTNLFANGLRLDCVGLI